MPLLEPIFFNIDLCLAPPSPLPEEAGVSILTSYGENPHYVKLPIFSEFMENSTKFMKNSDLTKWTQNLR